MGVPGNRALLACSIKMPCKWRITFDAAPGKRAKGAMNRGISGRPWDLSQAKSACFFRGSHEKQHPKSISGTEHATLAKWPPSPSIELGPLGVSAPPKEEKTVFRGVVCLCPPKQLVSHGGPPPSPRKLQPARTLRFRDLFLLGAPLQASISTSDTALRSPARLKTVHMRLMPHASEGDVMHKAAPFSDSPIGAYMRPKGMRCTKRRITSPRWVVILFEVACLWQRKLLGLKREQAPRTRLVWACGMARTAASTMPIPRHTKPAARQPHRPLGDHQKSRRVL